MEPEILRPLLDFCKLVIDENRLKILGILAQRSSSVTELAQLLGLKETLVSRHLARLHEAGLVQPVDQNQQTPYYQLSLETLHSLKKEFFTLEKSGRTSGVSVAAEGNALSTDSMLGRFFKDHKLTHIPANHAKRMLVLEWISNKFETGINYPEQKVNEILSHHYPDYASLRRALVDYGLMEREKGIYWRTDQTPDKL